MGALIISPHLDDAVLSVGQVMAGWPKMTVCTVFAGRPTDLAAQTSYDRDCGFLNAGRAVTRRRAEDKAALHVLNARPVWLDFVDHQYGDPNAEQAIVDAIISVVGEAQATVVLGPLGLAHPDHHTTRSAYCEALDRLDVEAWAYEDLPSRVLWPEQVPEALAWWQAHGWRAELGFVGTGPLELKQKALSRYTSQIWALTALNEHCCFVPERVWRLRRA